MVGLSNFWLFWYQKSVQIFIFFLAKKCPKSIFSSTKKVSQILFSCLKSVKIFFFISKKLSKNIFLLAKKCKKKYFLTKNVSQTYFSKLKSVRYYFFTFFFKIYRTFENIYEFISNILFKIVVNDLIHNLPSLHGHMGIVTSLRLLGPCQVKKVNRNLLIPSRRDC